MHSPIPPLPDRTILLHIGFHKTGTTALQSALAAVRPQLAEAGVLYPGRLSAHHRAAMAATGRRWGWAGKGGRRPSSRYWQELVREATAHQGRVVISSEAFSLTDDATMDQIVDRLGADRLQVVMTLRPIARLLPSSWQQYLKYGLTLPYGDWLEQAFADPPACPPSPNFWRRNDHVGISERWARRLGPDRVSVVVLDESDRGFLFRAFEQMLALPAGLLVPDAGLAASNRSMTAAEAEVLRLVNEGDAGQWGWAQYEKLVRRGAILRMVETRRPAADEEGVGTPAWAVAAAQAVGERTAQGLADLGITIRGDLATLADPMPADEPPDENLRLPVSAASEAVLGAISASMTGKPIPPDEDHAIDRLELPAVQSLTTREAAHLLRRRVRDARKRRMHGLTGALGRRRGSAET
jgi:hypothetical protein